MHAVTVMSCSLQKREMLCKYGFLKTQKTRKPKLGEDIVVTKVVPGCRAIFPQDPLSHPHSQPFFSPWSHHPWLPSGGVVTPPVRDLRPRDNGAGSVKHSAVTKASSLARLFKPMGSRAT